MIFLAVSVGIIAVLILAGIAGYVGWYLSHKSFTDGFTVGVETGYRACAVDFKALGLENNTKPTHLRPV